MTMRFCCSKLTIDVIDGGGGKTNIGECRYYRTGLLRQGVLGFPCLRLVLKGQEGMGTISS